MLEQITEDKILAISEPSRKKSNDLLGPLFFKNSHAERYGCNAEFREISTKLLIFEDRCKDWKQEDLRRTREYCVNPSIIFGSTPTYKTNHSIVTESIISLLVMHSVPEEDSVQENLETLREKENNTFYTPCCNQ